MRIPNLANSKLLRTSLLIGFYSGIVAVLPDIDHILSKIWEINNARFLHIPLCIIAMFIMFYCIARIRRLLNK